MSYTLLQLEGTRRNTDSIRPTSPWSVSGRPSQYSCALQAVGSTQQCTQRCCGTESKYYLFSCGRGGGNRKRYGGAFHEIQEHEQTRKKSQKSDERGKISDVWLGFSFSISGISPWIAREKTSAEVVRCLRHNII